MSAQSQKLILHHLNDSRSQRVLWLLEELEVPYEIKTYTRLADKRAPPELKEVHPLGLSPVITDGGVTLAESGPIVEYIIEKYGNGRLKPTDATKLDNMYWSHYCEGTLMPLLVNKLIFTIIPTQAPFFVRPIVRAICSGVDSQMLTPRLTLHAKYINDHLAKSTTGFFCGGPDLTGADFMMLFPLEAAGSRVEGGMGENATAYVKRMHERPAYKKALEKGGSYSYA